LWAGVWCDELDGALLGAEDLFLDALVFAGDFLCGSVVLAGLVELGLELLAALFGGFDGVCAPVFVFHAFPFLT
jgi:hypothetical protein